MRRFVVGLVVLVLGVFALAVSPSGAAGQDSDKGTALFVLTRQRIADLTAEDARFEVTRAPTFEVLVVEIGAGKLEDKNSYLGRYYEHAVRREGKKPEFGVYAKVQLKAQTKFINFKPIGDRVTMSYFAGPIGTVNVNPADKKKARPESGAFYVFQAEAVEPK
jgi:hypothetical protein